MKNIILLICLLSSVFVFAQKNIEHDEIEVIEEESSQQFSFYVRIPNTNNLPHILSKSSSGVSLYHQNTEIQAVFNKYQIFEFIQAFPTSSKILLKDVYLIKTNSIQLMKDLKLLFPSVFIGEVEIEEESPLFFESVKPISTFSPNDFGLSINQTDLELINAKTAWGYTKGNSSIKLGITDTEFNTSHAELNGTITATGNNGSLMHGTSVAFNMAGNTNNNLGLSSIGFNCYIEASTKWGYLGVNEMLLMSQSGIKVINGSWLTGYNIYHQGIIDEIYDNGTVLVFAAGNTQENTKKVYPASYDHVISVTSIHHKDFMQPSYDDFGNYIGDVLRKKDTHDNSWVWKQKKDGSHNHTPYVDIAAPGYLVPTVNSLGVYFEVNGTSIASPEVAGTIGLMLSANYSLDPDEVESIIKLTSANIYQIPENANYIDKLGAGRLDAGKAVEMAYKMAQSQDFIEVSDRDFYRDWTFILKNAPYGIKIGNETFRDSIKVDFTARNFIELENTVLEPNNIGYTYLSIDPSVPLPSVPNNNFTDVIVNNKINNSQLIDNDHFIFSHYVINNERVDVNLSSGEFTPNIKLKLNSETNLFEAEIGAFCNATSVVYEDKGDHLKVINRGATTLSQCDNDDNHFFKIVSGNIYLQNPAQIVYYSLTSDSKGLFLWVDANEKLYFSKSTLSVEEELLNNSISIYPNPTSKFVDVNSNGLDLLTISVVDVNGKVVLSKRNNLNRINVTNLSKGLYFLKITSSSATITKKMIVE